MPRTESKSTPTIISGALYTDDPATTGTRIDTPAWFEWLATGQSFYHAGCTFRAEQRRKGLSWYAFKKRSGKLSKAYAGRTGALTAQRLDAVAASLYAP